MESTARRLYFVLVITTFVLALPVVYGFASGWRLRSGFQVVATGALVVDSEPSGAQVWVEERKLPGSTPLRVASLTPGRYTVRVEKLGYVPWTKELTVEGGRATLALTVPLFRASPRISVLGAAPEQWSLNPTGSALLTERARSLSLFRFDSDTVEPLGNGGPWDAVSWSADGRRAVIRQGSTVELLTVGVPSRLTRIPLAASIVAIDPTDPDALLLRTERGLEQFGTTSLVRSVLIRGPLTAFAAATTDLAWLDGEGRLHQAKRTAAGRVVQDSVRSIAGEGVQFLSAGDRLLATSSAGLFLLEAAQPRQLLTDGPYAVTPDASGSLLLAESSVELWVVDLKNGGTSLLRRGSGTPRVAWLSPPPVALVGVNGITAMELDERGQRNLARPIKDPEVILVGADAQGRVFAISPERPGSVSGLLRLTVR